MRSSTETREPRYRESKGNDTTIRTGLLQGAQIPVSYNQSSLSLYALELKSPMSGTSPIAHLRLPEQGDEGCGSLPKIEISELNENTQIHNQIWLKVKTVVRDAMKKLRNGDAAGGYIDDDVYTQTIAIVELPSIVKQDDIFDFNSAFLWARLVHKISKLKFDEADEYVTMLQKLIPAPADGQPRSTSRLYSIPLLRHSIDELKKQFESCAPSSRLSKPSRYTLKAIVSTLAVLKTISSATKMWVSSSENGLPLWFQIATTSFNFLNTAVTRVPSVLKSDRSLVIKPRIDPELRKAFFGGGEASQRRSSSGLVRFLALVALLGVAWDAILDFNAWRHIIKQGEKWGSNSGKWSPNQPYDLTCPEAHWNSTSCLYPLDKVVCQSANSTLKCHPSPSTAFQFAIDSAYAVSAASAISSLTFNWRKVYPNFIKLSHDYERTSSKQLALTNFFAFFATVASCVQFYKIAQNSASLFGDWEVLLALAIGKFVMQYGASALKTAMLYQKYGDALRPGDVSRCDRLVRQTNPLSKESTPSTYFWTINSIADNVCTGGVLVYFGGLAFFESLPQCDFTKSEEARSSFSSLLALTAFVLNHFFVIVPLGRSSEVNNRKKNMTKELDAVRADHDSGSDDETSSGLEAQDRTNTPDPIGSMM